MTFRFVVDPIESGLDRQTREHANLLLIAVASCNVHSAALIVQTLARVAVVLVPAFDDAQFYIRPLVHHAYGQRGQFLF